MFAIPLPMQGLTTRGAVLVVGADDPFRRALTSEVQALPLPVRHAETLHEAARSVDPTADPKPRVVLVSEGEIDPDELEETIAEIRVRSGSPRVVPIVYGRAPSPERREALRQAGAELALFGRFGRHALRFQINRALAPSLQRSARGEQRAPMEWRTRAYAGGREKLVRCYTLSSAGGYFVTPRPWVVGSHVSLELPSTSPSRFVIQGRVVYTQAGHESERNLPRGMALAFAGVDEELEDVIRRGVAASQSALQI